MWSSLFHIQSGNWMRASLQAGSHGIDRKNHYSLTDPKKKSFVIYLSKFSGPLTNSGLYNVNSRFTNNHSHQRRAIKSSGWSKPLRSRHKNLFEQYFPHLGEWLCWKIIFIHGEGEKLKSGLKIGKDHQNHFYRSFYFYWSFYRYSFFHFLGWQPNPTRQPHPGRLANSLNR